MMALLPRSGYDEDHESFRDSVRKFCASEVVPHLDHWRSEGCIPADLFRSLGDQGFLGTAVPGEFSGGGVDDPRFTAVLVEEAMTAGAAGLALILAHHSGVCVPAVLRLPDSELRSSWLAGLAGGTLVGVPALLSPTLHGDGVPGAAVAGILVAGVPGDEGPTTAVLPREAVGLEPVHGSLGGREAGAADVRVDGSVLADFPSIPDGAATLQRDLDLWSAVVAVAGARAALELTLTYVAERKVFGRPVAEFENTRFRLAEIAAEIAGAEAFTGSCLAALSDGTLSAATAAAVRLTSGRAHDRAVDQGMQFHGGYGYMREYPISHAFGDARFLRLAAAAATEPRETLAAALGI